jgi:hypothetical protein
MGMVPEDHRKGDSPKGVIRNCGAAPAPIRALALRWTIAMMGLGRRIGQGPCPQWIPCETQCGSRDHLPEEIARHITDLLDEVCL